MIGYDFNIQRLGYHKLIIISFFLLQKFLKHFLQALVLPPLNSLIRFPLLIEIYSLYHSDNLSIHFNLLLYEILNNNFRLTIKLFFEIIHFFIVFSSLIFY